MSIVSSTCVHDIYYNIIIIVGVNCHFQQLISVTGISRLSVVLEQKTRLS